MKNSNQLYKNTLEDIELEEGYDFSRSNIEIHQGKIYFGGGSVSKVFQYLNLI